MSNTQNPNQTQQKNQGAATQNQAGKQSEKFDNKQADKNNNMKDAGVRKSSDDNR